MIKQSMDYNESVSSNTEFIDELKEKLPQFFVGDQYDEEGNVIVKSQFDSERFFRALKVNNINELSEGYQLSFVGRDYARKQAGEKATTVVVPNIKHNEKEINVNSKNLFFTGDNLEVLRHLKNNYKNSIDVIYIDPPYNTGNDGFIYPDKFEYSDEMLKNMFGLNDDELMKLKSIQGKSTHSAWLTFMYPRLKLAWYLLKKDGVIFISIDDNELTNLTQICNEIFGETNRIGILPTVMNMKGNNDEFGFAGTHEYTLCFIKDVNSRLDLSGVDLTLDDIKEYKFEDEFGKYKKGATLMRTGEAGAREKRPKGYYPIYVSQDMKSFSIYKNNEDDIEVYPKTQNGKEMSWRRSPSNLEETKSEFIIVNSKKNISFIKKQRLSDDLSTGKKMKSLLYKPEYSSGNGTEMIKSLFGERMFDNPKPVELCKDLCKIGLTGKDGIVMDFFAGSASTADAVMRLNASDGGTRQYIMVQIDEPTWEYDKNKFKVASKKNSVPFTHGFTSIDEISRKRIELSAAKIQEADEFQIKDNFDGGFKHYIVTKPKASSLLDLHSFDFKSGMFRDSKGVSTVFSDDGFDDMIRPFSAEHLNIEGKASGVDTILTTWMIQDGYKLDKVIQKNNIMDYDYYFVNDSQIYMIDKGWNSEHTRELLNMIGNFKLNIHSIIIYSYSFDLESIREIEIGLKQLNQKVNLVKRY